MLLNLGETIVRLEQTQIELYALWKKTNGNINEYVKGFQSIFSKSLEGKIVLLQLAIAIAQLPPNEALTGKIWASSLVSGRDKEPYVILQHGDKQFQLSPDDARQHAHQIMIAADAAESDAFLFKFALNELKLDEDIAGAILVSFRKFRERKVQ
jgi:hypothetical protein